MFHRNMNIKIVVFMLFIFFIIIRNHTVIKEIRLENEHKIVKGFNYLRSFKPIEKECFKNKQKIVVCKYYKVVYKYKQEYGEYVPVDELVGMKMFK